MKIGNKEYYVELWSKDRGKDCMWELEQRDIDLAYAVRTIEMQEIMEAHPEWHDEGSTPKEYCIEIHEADFNKTTQTYTIEQESGEDRCYTKCGTCKFRGEPKPFEDKLCECSSTYGFFAKGCYYHAD